MLRPTRENWVVLGIAGAMLLTATTLVYLRQGRELDQLRTQILERQTALESSAAQVAVVPNLIRQVQAMKDRYQDFDRKLPRTQELGAFLRQIDASLSENGLSSLSIEPGKPSREEYFNALPVIMKLRGSYLSLAGLLDSMERMERLSRVQRIVITKDGKGDDLNIEMQINVYFTQSGRGLLWS
jgi:Tfp pilus assembly protein PilO